MMTTIDLNSDLGEGVATGELSAEELDDALLAVITSANVACGGHAGDLRSMTRICARARDLRVSIGAQVSYVDRAGFGRRRLDIAPDLLTEQLHEQLVALSSCARAVGTELRYVKPHGALYNTAADEDDVALAVIRTILRDADERGHAIPVLTLPNSVLAQMAQQNGVAAYAEGFADRAYTETGRLVPRSEEGAVIDDPSQVQAQVLSMVLTKKLTTMNGSSIDMECASICVHSDTDGALALARQLRTALEDSGIALRPFIDVSNK